MEDDTRLTLASFDDGRAVVDVSYGTRRARVEIDRIEHGHSGQTNAEATREELAAFVRAMSEWLATPGATLRTE